MTTMELGKLFKMYEVDNAIILYGYLLKYAKTNGSIEIGDVLVDPQTIEKLRELTSPEALGKELTVNQESAIKLFEALKQKL